MLISGFVFGAIFAAICIIYGAMLQRLHEKRNRVYVVTGTMYPAALGIFVNKEDALKFARTYDSYIIVPANKKQEYTQKGWK